MSVAQQLGSSVARQLSSSAQQLGNFFSRNFFHASSSVSRQLSSSVAQQLSSVAQQLSSVAWQLFLCRKFSFGLVTRQVGSLVAQQLGSSVAHLGSLVTFLFSRKFFHASSSVAWQLSSLVAFFCRKFFLAPVTRQVGSLVALFSPLEKNFWKFFSCWYLSSSVAQYLL